MELLYISCFQFKEENDEICALPAYGNAFWEKYLDVFDSIKVLGEPIKKYLDDSSTVKITNQKISVDVIWSNTHPKDFKNDRQIKKKLEKEIEKAEAILIKPSSRKGMMAIKIAERLNKPYMIELTGDIHNALKQSDNFFRRMYAPILYHKINKHIKNCKFALYVSEYYLQKVYPIKGTMCGCSDVVLHSINEKALDRRIEKINSFDNSKEIKIALIGYYQGTGKGIDTAIEAMGGLPENMHLYVLGSGTKENRDKWIGYGEDRNVYNRIHFPDVLKSTEDVLRWLDDMDLMILPSRSEGLARCIAEAMSRGCPCIATNICTNPELLQQEWLHEIGDSQKLKELIMKMLSNKDVMISVAKENFKNSKRFQFEVLRQRRNDFLMEFRNYCLGK